MLLDSYSSVWNSGPRLVDTTAETSRAEAAGQPSESSSNDENKIIRLRRPWWQAFPIGTGPQAA